MPEDFIDITSSPIKTINKSKIHVHGSSNLKNHTVINNRKLSKLPLQEIEENTLKSNNEVVKEENSRKRKKRKRKSPVIPVQSTLKFYDMKNYEVNEYIAKNCVLEAENKIPASYSKLHSRHEELKASIINSRQAFSSYKLSTYFKFNSEFIKEYGDNLSKMEQAIKDMDTSLEKAIAKDFKVNSTYENKNVCLYTSKVTSLIKEKQDLPASPLCELKIQNQDTPPSESKDLKNDLHITRKRRSKKRKLIFNSDETNEQDEQSTRKKRVRKCTVKNPTVPKLVVESDNISSDINISTKNMKEEEADQSESKGLNSETDKEVEYEVRKIQDFVRKQGSFYYKVSWRGYDSDDDTFEPADHLDGCDEVLTDFLYKRLQEREKIKSVDELKNLPLPCDEKVKELIYNAFEKLVLSIPKSDCENGIQVVTSKNTSFKTKEELQDDICKFLSMRDPSFERYKKAYNNIIEQITYKDLYRERLKQLADLREWERSMNVICSDPAPLTVENNVDLTLPPLDFIYINEYVPGPNVVIPSVPVAGCECKECNPLQKACCSNMMGSYFAYNKMGRLRVSLGTPIYECNRACSCSLECWNRVVQNGRKVSLCIFRTSNKRGWGVKALEPIKKDQFVCEYVGEVITSEEAEERGMKYDTMGSTYLFDLDYNKGDQNPYTVDAVRYGNVSHFINHSCDPNLVVFNVWVNCLDPDLPRLALFAARDIKKGEEITFDYNSGSTRQISIIDKIEGIEESTNVTPTKHEGGVIPTTEIIRKTPKNRVLKAGKTRCRCGSANCRSYFF